MVAHETCDHALSLWLSHMVKSDLNLWKQTVVMVPTSSAAKVKSGYFTGWKSMHVKINTLKNRIVYAYNGTEFIIVFEFPIVIAS